MSDLTSRVHAGIGASGSRHLDRISVELGQGGLERTLNRGVRGLPLPAGKRATVILDKEGIARHDADLTAWDRSGKGAVMQNSDVAVTNGAVTLAGTLSQPDGSSDVAVICLHGTGGMDRDQNMPGQALRVFSPFAEAFAAAGIATYRYDKRGCGASTGEYISAGHFDLVGDAKAVILAMRAQGFAKVVLLGHSEGTLIAAELVDHADALVLLSPFVTPIRQLLLNQADAAQRMIDEAKGVTGWMQRKLVALFGGARRVQERLIARIEASDAAVMRHSGQKLPAASLRELLALDIEAAYRAILVPTLAICGGKDVQCPPADAETIAELARPHAEVRLIADLTHLLRLSDDPPGFQYYGEQLKRPVDPGVVALVTDWIKRVALLG
jgi:uncharacterized protein